MSQRTKAINKKGTKKAAPKAAASIGEQYLRGNDTPDQIEDDAGVVIEFKHELLDHFLDKADDFGKQHDEHTGEAVNRIENYERLQDEHKGLHDDNHANHHERRKLTEKIIQQSKEFEAYTKDSAAHKRNLRGELDDLEDTLRKLKDQISEVEIENKNLQLIAETEQSIQDAKDRAEADAINAVNRDLKELVSRLAADSEADISYQEVSERIKADVSKNYNQSQNDFNRFLQQSEVARNELAEDLKELRDRADQRNADNDELKNKIEQGEDEADRLNSAINALTTEIDNLKRNNDDAIRNLHRDRQSNEDTITDLRKQNDDLRLEHTKLEIGIMKINSQLQYLEEAAKSGGNELIRKKIDKFGRHITQVEQDTEQLKSDLNGMNRNWMDTIDRANREIADHIKDNDSKATNDKINALLNELQAKQAEIDELKRSRLSGQVDAHGEIDSLNSELAETNKELIDLLREKNRLYGELIQYTRELFELNTILQKNEHEIARLRLELESLRKEQDEKRVLYEELMMQIEERRQMLADLQDEIARNELILQQLEETLNLRKEEGAELDQLLADRDEEIRQLEAQLEEINRNRPVEVEEPVVEAVKEPEPVADYVADKNDDVDQLLAQFLNLNACPVPIKRLGGGYYLFGTRKIYAKVMNGKLVIRVGGGYMVIDEFIATYAEVEVQKMEARRARGLDPVPDVGGDSSPSNRSFGSPKGSSPKTRTMKRDNSGSPGGSKSKTFMGGTAGSSINGTVRSKKLDQNKFDRLRAQGAARVIGSPK